jgi:hypothetical protein
MNQTHRPKLLQQYRSVGMNFVLLHKPDDVKTHYTCKRTNQPKPLKKPLQLGKAPVQNDWPNQKVGYDLAVQHMSDGKNVGVQMSTAGYAVIDYDPRHDPNAGSADNSLVKLLRDADMLGMQHCMVTTGSLDGPVRGKHIYVRIDPDWRGRTVLDKQVTKYPGVEFKHSPGQQVVACGSVHPTGGVYLFDEDSVPLADAAKATAKLLEIFENKRPPSRAIGDQMGWALYTPASIRRALLGETTEDGERIPGLSVDLYNGEHDKWLQFMISVHFASGGEASDAFVEWCTQDAEYSEDAVLIRERWDTFTVDGSSGPPITEATMFKHFVEGKLDPRLYPSVRLERAFEDLTEEDLLLDATPESDEARVLRFMNQRHALVLMDREPLYLKPGVSLVDGETPMYNLVTASVLAAFYKNKLLTRREGKSVVKESWYDFWNTHPRRREYQGWIFKPSIDNSDVDLGQAGVYLNRFQGWPYSKTDRGRGEWRLFKELIYRVLAQSNDDWYDYIIKWMAYSVQYPEQPQQVLMVFQGKKGIGKSLVTERWKRLFGNGGMTTQRMEDLVGQFNHRLATTCALLMEEGIWAGDKAAENRLKQLITGESVQTEAKFANAQETANYLSIIMNTNEQWAVPASPDERRFAVFEAIEVWPKNDPFFGKVIREMDYEGGMQAFFFDLFHMDLGDWRPQGAIPMTPALAAQMGTTLGPVAEWWGEILERGEIPYSIPHRGDTHTWGTSPVYVHYKALKDDFKAKYGPGLSKKWSRNFDKTFKSELGSIIPADFEAVKIMTHPNNEEFYALAHDHSMTPSGGPRSRFVMLPTFIECKTYAEKRGVGSLFRNSKSEEHEERQEEEEEVKIEETDEWAGSEPFA